MQDVGGNVTAKSEFLRGFEEVKQYPPRLSLRVVRTPHQVQQDLETVVTVDGVDPVCVCVCARQTST